jgi:hypothetical protein
MVEMRIIGILLAGHGRIQPAGQVVTLNGIGDAGGHLRHALEPSASKRPK